ncbi:MAG: serine/threonine-protein kinase [Nannocystaceae bacterium]
MRRSYPRYFAGDAQDEPLAGGDRRLRPRRAHDPAVDAGERPSPRPGAAPVDRADRPLRRLHLLGAERHGPGRAAYDEALDRKVAIKLLITDGQGDAEGRSRLRREAQAMARVAHPNVVPIFEVGEHGGRIFLAMEGTSRALREWAADAARGWRELVDVYVQAARGLAAAHDAGIVHRDFKPDNALVSVDADGSPRVRVLDFGLAALPGATAAALERMSPGADASLTLTGAIMGTPAYMAPEQQTGGELDARVDVFALCVALYEAVYGARPFAGATIPELFAAVQAGAIAPLPEAAASTPKELYAVVRRGLAVDPGARWPTMAALVEALAGLLGANAERARDRRRGLRVRLGFVAIAAALAAAAILREVIAPSASRSTTGHQLRFNAVILGLLALSALVSRRTLRRSRYDRRVFTFLTSVVATISASNLNFHLHGLPLDAALATDLVVVAGFFLVGSMLIERWFVAAILPCAVGLALLAWTSLPGHLAFELAMLANLFFVAWMWWRHASAARREAPRRLFSVAGRVAETRARGAEAASARPRS